MKDLPWRSTMLPHTKFSFTMKTPRASERATSQCCSQAGQLTFFVRIQKPLDIPRLPQSVQLLCHYNVTTSSASQQASEQANSPPLPSHRQQQQQQFNRDEETDEEVEGKKSNVLVHFCIFLCCFMCGVSFGVKLRH